MRRIAIVMAVAAASMLVLVAPAGANEVGTTSSRVPAIPCSVSPGHYCVRIFYTSVSGGIRMNETKSTGYTTGAGKGREWFRYSCSAGTCYILPSATFFYGSADVQLNVNRVFGGSGFFLPCGNRFGVQYFRPAKHAPSTVTRCCSG